ncbi:MAG TPA: hypothetical protein VJL32_03645, partial [Candidatus Paceibacterota bacterium]
RDENLGIPKDSKQLNPKRRENWLRYFKNHPEIFYVTARVEPKVIDKINISAAANSAAWRAFRSVLRKSGVAENKAEVFLDGGLYLRKRGFYARSKTVIKGDEKIPAISIASIIAKVCRDKLMGRMARKHPGYGFEIHKGYGTKTHYSALRRLGPSAIHRLTFLKKKHKITKS